MHKNILAVIIALLSGAASSWALSIDLTSSAWSPANGTRETSVGSVTTFAAFPPGSVPSWSSNARPGDDADRILASSPVEIINIRFANSYGNGLTGASIGNLFSGSLKSRALELVTTTGTDILDFSGTSSGNVSINFGRALKVLTAEFCGLDSAGQLFNQSYSVKGLTSVPDGGTTLTLLGIGLLSLVVFRRKLAF